MTNDPRSRIVVDGPEDKQDEERHQVDDHQQTRSAAEAGKRELGGANPWHGLEQVNRNGAGVSPLRALALNFRASFPL